MEPRTPTTVTAEGQIREMSWEEKQEVERDICLLYHQIALDGCFGGGRYWGSVYRLRYWDYLQVTNLEPAEATFLRDGCLVLLLAMAWAAIDREDDYLRPHLDACRTAVDRVRERNARTVRLCSVVRKALEMVSQHEAPDDDYKFLSGETHWVYEEYVKGYFAQMAGETES